MSDPALAELLSRCLLDVELRERLWAEPEATLRACGLEPTPERLAELSRVDRKQLEKAGKLLERRFMTMR